MPVKPMELIAQARQAAELPDDERFGTAMRSLVWLLIGAIHDGQFLANSHRSDVDRLLLSWLDDHGHEAVHIPNVGYSFDASRYFDTIEKAARHHLNLSAGES